MTNIQTLPSRTAIILAAALMCAVALMPLAASANHSGSTVQVDDSDPNPDGGGCGSNANKCNTIQAAVDHASTGQKVTVAPGTYTENVSVSKKLTIEGAQESRDATTRNVAIAKESVVNGSFNLQANDVTLDGFIIQNNASGPGVQTGPTFSGYKIENNIIRNNVFGLYLHGSGTNKTTVGRNFFDNNNQTGAANGNAIYSDQGLKNAMIERNKSNLHGNSAFTLTKGAPAQPNNSNITYERNESIRDVNMVNLYHTNNADISRNIARGINDPNVDGGAIFLAGDDHNVTISRNEIRDRSWTGIILANLVSIPSTDVLIERNILRTLGNDGIDVRDDSVGTGEANLSRNEIRNVTKDGILLGAVTSGNTILKNFVRNSGEHDAHDNSLGAGTAGTANIWDDNDCNTDLPNGICE
ncbi:MAG: hypothetical protein HYR90_01760 [Candidatus Andersenbacteria bacterium]|nr:hypothetical protein [Candidatus Andersenbacteria bacterium]MBI3250886.1 hypothetical protein [Candidatus Andersenbacteria bacterium]